jgi:hypothetical protein
VLVVVTEDGLSTAVNAGENGGRTLHHAAVVRSLQSVGDSDKGVFDKVVEVPTRPDWNVQKLKVAVVVQDSATMRVLGAASVPYTR